MKRDAIESTLIAILAAGVSFSATPAFAQPTERWHLLVPPAAYNKELHRFVRISDAPLAEWYHEGEFATYGECHNARAGKALEAEQYSHASKDADNWFHADPWAYQHGRCISSKDMR